MAEVWLAERCDGAFKRQVAIKLPYPKPGRETFAVRFDRERDILASLRHPNIAGLFDAGVTQERQAWLALEYVEGEPISAFCDRQRLTLRERVTLWIQRAGNRRLPGRDAHREAALGQGARLAVCGAGRQRHASGAVSCATGHAGTHRAIHSLSCTSAGRPSRTSSPRSRSQLESYQPGPANGSQGSVVVQVKSVISRSLV
jgi:hypothetical protein